MIPSGSWIGPCERITSSATGTGLANYSIGYVNGSLTVNPAALTITASSKTKTYGQTLTLDGASDFSLSGLLNSDAVSRVALASSGIALRPPSEALLTPSPRALLPGQVWPTTASGMSTAA